MYTIQVSSVHKEQLNNSSYNFSYLWECYSRCTTWVIKINNLPIGVKDCEELIRWSGIAVDFKRTIVELIWQRADVISLSSLLQNFRLKVCEWIGWQLFCHVFSRIAWDWRHVSSWNTDIGVIPWFLKGNPLTCPCSKLYIFICMGDTCICICVYICKPRCNCGYVNFHFLWLI